MKHWRAQELAALRRLRDGFLAETNDGVDYWSSESDLALYDATFAERIGWKWDAVLSELVLRGWRPRSRRLLDWGCGSGVAARRVLGEWGDFERVDLHDRSRRAEQFAAKSLNTPARVGHDERPDENTLLLFSHVLNEQDDARLATLAELARGAGEIIWVEPGTSTVSRMLIGLREKLRGDFHVVAPCPHAAVCGLLTAENQRHWCHHFSRAPSVVAQDAKWREFSEELRIDLRSVPYSFLVLSRAEWATPHGWSRQIGYPRESKGYARVLSCREAGVADLMLQKRDAPRLLKRTIAAEAPGLFRFEEADGKIVGGTEWGSEEAV